MADDAADARRRAVLQAAAGLAAGAQALPSAAAPDKPPETPALPGARPPVPTGQPGDFDFLAGEWRIRHRRLKDDGSWDLFDGEATVWSILAGAGSVEELRIPARQFIGMGLRLLDRERRLWADHWVPGRTGVLTPPPSWGSFVDGVGLWDSDDEDGGRPLIVRGAWDQITPRSCRWYQASSRDGGRSWQDSWVMHWQRA